MKPQLTRILLAAAVVSWLGPLASAQASGEAGQAEPSTPSPGIEAAGPPAGAQESKKGSFEDLWTREHMLDGAFGGLRSYLGQHGVDLDFRLSQFYQGNVSGGADSGEGEYGVMLDSWINADAEKSLGLWPGLSISAHVQTRGGNDIGAEAGPFVMPNASLLYPLPGNYHGTDITNFVVSQELFDGQAAVLGGKLGSFDMLQGLFPHIVDFGLDGFMNANSYMSILSWGRWLTLSQYGLAGWTYENGLPSTGFILAGSENQSDQWGRLDDSFDDGVGIMVFHRFQYEVADKAGYLYIGGGGSTKEYDSLEEADWVQGPDGVPTATEEDKPWGVASYFYQEFWRENEDRFAHTFFGGSVADDNPSFSDWDVFAQVQAHGLFDARPNDRMGIAGHYYHLGDDFVDLVSTIPGVDLRSSFWTSEIFYNYEINPWLHLTPNFQYAQDANDGDDPSVILGARLVLDL
jgi:porin